MVTPWALSLSTPGACLGRRDQASMFSFSFLSGSQATGKKMGGRCSSQERRERNMCWGLSPCDYFVSVSMHHVHLPKTLVRLFIMGMVSLHVLVSVIFGRRQVPPIFALLAKVMNHICLFLVEGAHHLLLRMERGCNMPCRRSRRFITWAHAIGGTLWGQVPTLSVYQALLSRHICSR